ncbi:glycosyltransferase [Roseovarius salis]|uniref:glycosyltransferase family 2 protein n=1 Tax=Roseovarius salis TaxID=3376063 RepID=UPI0037C7E0C6
MTERGITLDIKRTDRNRDRACSVDICIPVYRTDPTALIHQLSQQDGAESVALRIYDDGSGDAALSAEIHAALAEYPGKSSFLEAAANCGRTAGRNAMLSVAETDWILLLDSDMRIDATDFLSIYRNAAAECGEPCCIVGGFAIDPETVAPGTQLHAHQSVLSECLPAMERARDPGRYVFTSNIFLHRTIIEREQFDEGFAGWGWEDVEWGLRIAGRYPVVHVDNPAVHLGLDTANDILGKYRESADNFLRLLAAHPQAVARMPLYRWARRFAGMPGLGLLVNIAARCAGADLMPMRLRLVALKVFRAGTYGAALNDAGQ